MKKTAAILLAVMLVASALSGCTSNKTPPGTSSSEPASMPAPASSMASETQMTSGGLKTGMGIHTTVTKSKDAATGEEGIAQSESTVAAVLIGADGKIVDCVIDETQTKILFDQSGALKTPVDATFQTKGERGGAYGMKKESAIGKEWNEQAAAFAAYAVGKTMDEIKGIAVNDKGAPTDTELSASVTISVGNFIGALETAVRSAQEIGARQGDHLGLGILTDVAKSQDAGENAGLAQADSDYAAGTFDADNRITSCLLDGSQAKVAFDKSGKITTDLTAVQKTKNELGDAYGMKKASSIGKEWFDQAGVFADYAKGKTIAELRGIKLTEKGAPEGGELASSVTIAVGDFITVLEKASYQAK